MKTLKGIFFKDFQNSYIPEILQELYRDKVYAPLLEGKKDLTILDIGANIGLFSLYASDFAKKIYAFEPAKEHVETMAAMLEFNGLTDKVIIVPRAISDKDGTATFHHSKNQTMYSLSPLVNDNQEVEEVQTMTIETAFDELKLDHVDFMKLDIEGAESEVVCGKPFENVSKKIDSMVVEWHTWGGRNPSQIVTALSDYGFKVTPISADATLFSAVKI